MDERDFSRYDGPAEAPRPRDAGAPGSMPGLAAKADLIKRFVAALIDGAIAAVISLIPVLGGIAAAAYLLLRDGFEFEFMDRRSVGKKVMKLRPVRLDGRPMELADSAMRNWMFALGGVISVLLWIPVLGWFFVLPVAVAGLGLGLIELILVLSDPQGRRLGDKMAATQVIEVAD